MTYTFNDLRLNEQFSIKRQAHLYIYKVVMSVCLSVCLFVYLSVCLSICLSVCFSDLNLNLIGGTQENHRSVFIGSSGLTLNRSSAGKRRE